MSEKFTDLSDWKATYNDGRVDQERSRGAAIDEASPWQIEAITQVVPGGLANVQDIYPLAPLQEGILFHCLLNEQVDTYVLSVLFQCATRVELQALIRALDVVIDRHDILRSSMLWEGLPRPMQVVHRRATLQVEERTLDARRDALEQLKEWMKPLSKKRDLRKAPLLWLEVAEDPRSSCLYGVLKIHHLVCDHQSLRVVVLEVMSLLKGQENELPVPVPFRRYVVQALEQLSAAEAKAFFASKLGDVTEPTAPFEVFDVHGDGSQIEEQSQLLPVDLVSRVRAQARAFGVSPARFFHAAWGLVVARTSGRDDIVYGTVVLTAGQRAAQAQRMLGLSVNTLPLRLRLQGITAEGLLEQTHRELGELLKHEAASLSLARGCSGIHGTAPLFTSLLNYRHSTPLANDEPLGTAGVRVLERGEAWTNYPLTVTVDDLGDGILLTVKADRCIGSVRILNYLATALRSLSEALEQSPGMPVVAISVLPLAEREQVVERFNATRMPKPEDELIHKLFEQQVERSPNALAVRAEQSSTTYVELNKRANQLAHYLRRMQIGPDQPVVLCLDRSAEMLVSVLGILKAGGAYVPLDPSNPASRLEYLLSDAAPRVLVTRGNLRSIVGSTAATIVSIDEDWAHIQRESEENIEASEISLSPKNLAYVIYTSGTTGRPKGVMVEHRNIANYASHALRHFDVASGDGALVCTSLSFDLMLTGLYPTLLSGRAVRLCPEQHGVPALADEILKCRNLAPLKLTPSHLSLLEQPLRSGQLVGRVQALVLGGEPLPTSAVQLWQRFAPGTRLFNHYGPTETTVGCIIHEIGDVSPGTVPLGRPISNTQIYILDRQGRPTPIGVVGEIHIGGAGVTRGYLNRPELTAERFVADPFSADTGSRMYKTGDLGRWRTDGVVEYLGRNDHQVKIRGFRIETGEIEAQLLRHEHVREAVVLPWEGSTGERCLVAYVVPGESLDSPSAMSVDTLRAHVKAELPDYMVPSAFVLLERMPLTANGKLDRHALPDPGTRAEGSTQYEAPRGEVEDVLAGIWRELLRVERVGRQDNFFELGGHSLLIMQMMERLRRVGLSTEVRRVFESPVLVDLASALITDASEKTVVPDNSIPPQCVVITPEMLPLVALDQEHIEGIVAAVPGGAANVEDIYPLTPLQEGILFHHLLNEDGCDAYVRPMVLSVASRKRVEELVAALQVVIDRHDVLRTAVLWEQLPRPVQVVFRRATLMVEEVAPAASLAEQVKQWLSPQHQRMDLTRAPLIRMQVAKGSDGDNWLVLLQTHHITSDHSSQEIVISEVVAQLNGSVQPVPHSMPYRNHVAQALAHARTHDAEVFFRAKLGDIEETTAPFGLVDVHGDGSESREGREDLDPEVSGRLRQQARRYGVTAATLFHAAWGVVVAGTSGRDDVVFGTVLLGRLHGGIGTNRVLGMFINTLPLRLQLSDLTVKELVEYTQRALVELLRHEQASLTIAQRCSGISGSAPLFTALFNYRHSAPNPDAHWSSAGQVRVLASAQRTNYPISLSVDDSGEGFTLNAQTDHRIDPLRIMSYVRTVLRSLVDALEAGGRAKALDLPILPESERRRVVVSFNETEASYPRETMIHELFEEQVMRAPKATAVVYEGQILTYTALNGRANQLARYLREQGAKSGDYIPVLMARSLNMLVAQLAVLKSGAVYLPVDPELPAERRAFMIKDCVARHVLADRDVPRDWVMGRVRWINYSEVLEQVERFSTGNIELKRVITPPAYVMYTSGSTGVPKGVVVPHHAVNRLVINNGYATISSSDCLIHYSNPAFDASTFEIWGALLNGARLVVVPPAVVLDVDSLRRVLLQQQVTLLWMSVGLFNQYTEILSDVFVKLRYLIIGGDSVDAEAVRRVLRNSPPQCLLNAYGPTECTTFSTTHLVRAADDASQSIPIGRPIANAQMYILNSRMQPVPTGVAGEIYIGGAGIAQAYLNRPELTAERFVADPFSIEPTARMYKTGDLGRWRSDGAIEFLGRNDNQVKIRGFRIEPGEVEAQLARHADVKEAVVVPWEQRLVAYVVLRVRAEVDSAPRAETLRAFLKGVLPDYMVPSAIVLLDRMPLTANGKVDRRGLPAPDIGSYSTRHHELPEGQVEELLALIWQDVLRIEGIGRNDNFFELGGHSLVVLQSLARINRMFGCTLSVRDVYHSPTLRELATRIAGRALEENIVDLAQEAVLNDDIVARSGVLRGDAKAILVTGASGFVGRFLLAQLLVDTDATMYCLIRSPSQYEAAARLTAILTKWNLWRDEFSSRIVAVPGDLRMPRLGIDESTYRVLSLSVDTIYHCATSMNHLETYAMARSANVESARELLKLATTAKSKLINYISTLSVFSTPGRDDGRIMSELSSIDNERHSTLRGYAASKWVSERIFITAGERGIPCNIFRLGLVWADSQQGRYDESQREYRLLKSCLMSGYGIQGYGYTTAPVPVDWVARSVVCLSRLYRHGKGIFHIMSSNETGDYRLFERCNEISGLSLQLLPHYEWISEMKRIHHTGWSLPIVPLIDHSFTIDEVAFYENEQRIRLATMRMDNARTRRELEHAGIVFPGLTDGLIRATLRSMFSTDEELVEYKSTEQEVMVQRATIGCRTALSPDVQE